MHLIGFIIRIYHDAARSAERQFKFSIFYLFIVFIRSFSKAIDILNAVKR